MPVRLHTVCLVLLVCGAIAASAQGDARDVEIRQAPGAGGGDRWAVVVGVEQYKSAEIAPARFADRDARGLAKTLQDVGGFPAQNVKLLADGETGELEPTRANILYWLIWLRDHAKADDTAVFFFAGHGYDIGGEQYLLPIEADNRHQTLLDDTCLRLTRVREELDRIQSGRTVVFIDACSVDPRSDRAGGDNLMTSAFDQALSGRARAVYYACDVGHRAYPRADKEHGVFTYYLLEGLGGKAAGTDGYVDLPSLVSYVDAQMDVWNRDHPDKAMTPRIDMRCTGRVVLSCPSDDADPVPTMATLAVSGTPEGAEVSVDGRVRGRVPCEVTDDLGLAAERTVEVGATKAGYRSAVARVTLRRGEVTRWRLDLQRSYTLLTSSLGHEAPGYEPGITPSVLGWGPDSQAYPERFIVDPGDLGEYVWVPAGEFMMGSGDGAGDEDPVHRVRITRGLWLSKCEVTNAQYSRFCDATGHRTPEEADWGQAAWRSGGYPPDVADHPVACVDWGDAQAYCEHYGLRLPTEAEWEYAARGAKGMEYPWGHDWDKTRCCGCENRGPGGNTYRVGSLPDDASWCGALDLAGNVSEWCSDRYGEGYYGVSSEADPPGSAVGESRVLRGGSWSTYTADSFRCASRGASDPYMRCSDRGFRCARMP